MRPPFRRPGSPRMMSFFIPHAWQTAYLVTSKESLSAVLPRRPEGFYAGGGDNYVDGTVRRHLSARVSKRGYPLSDLPRLSNIPERLLSARWRDGPRIAGGHPPAGRGTRTVGVLSSHAKATCKVDIYGDAATFQHVLSAL